MRKITTIITCVIFINNTFITSALYARDERNNRDTTKTNITKKQEKNNRSELRGDKRHKTSSRPKGALIRNPQRKPSLPFNPNPGTDEDIIPEDYGLGDCSEFIEQAVINYCKENNCNESTSPTTLYTELQNEHASYFQSNKCDTVSVKGWAEEALNKYLNNQFIKLCEDFKGTYDLKNEKCIFMVEMKDKGTTVAAKTFIEGENATCSDQFFDSNFISKAENWGYGIKTIGGGTLAITGGLIGGLTTNKALSDATQKVEETTEDGFGTIEGIKKYENMTFNEIVAKEKEDISSMREKLNNLKETAEKLANARQKLTGIGLSNEHATTVMEYISKQKSYFAYQLVEKYLYGIELQGGWEAGTYSTSTTTTYDGDININVTNTRYDPSIKITQIKCESGSNCNDGVYSLPHPFSIGEYVNSFFKDLNFEVIIEEEKEETNPDINLDINAGANGGGNWRTICQQVINGEFPFKTSNGEKTVKEWCKKAISRSGDVCTYGDPDKLYKYSDDGKITNGDWCGVMLARMLRANVGYGEDSTETNSGKLYLMHTYLDESSLSQPGINGLYDKFGLLIGETGDKTNDILDKVRNLAKTKMKEIKLPNLPNNENLKTNGDWKDYEYYKLAKNLGLDLETKGKAIDPEIVAFLEGFNIIGDELQEIIELDNTWKEETAILLEDLINSDEALLELVIRLRTTDIALLVPTINKLIRNQKKINEKVDANIEDVDEIRGDLTDYTGAVTNYSKTVNKSLVAANTMGGANTGYNLGNMIGNIAEWAMKASTKKNVKCYLGNKKIADFDKQFRIPTVKDLQSKKYRMEYKQIERKKE